MEIRKHDVVVFGAGATGLRAAVEAQRFSGNVAVVSKVHPMRVQSTMATSLNAALGTGPGMDVVTLMVSASVFAIGLKTIGVIGLLTEAAKNSGTGDIGIVIVMTAIIVLVGALTGSGNAAFFSFCTLAPDIATGMGFAPVLLVLPMQLAAGMGRAMSPVAGVIIICAGIAKESPLTVTKRTVIPMLVGIVTLLAATIIIHF